MPALADLGPAQSGAGAENHERIIRDANSAADVVGRVRALFRQTDQARNLCPLDAILHEARDLMMEEAARRRHTERRNVPLAEVVRAELEKSAQRFRRMRPTTGMRSMILFMTSGVDSITNRQRTGS